MQSLKRREFITLLGGAAVSWPLGARAQQSDRMRQVGVLMGTSESDPHQNALVSEFTRVLADLGWKEGANLRIERRWAEGELVRLRAQAAELARIAPDALFAQGHRRRRRCGKWRPRRRWYS